MKKYLKHITFRDQSILEVEAYVNSDQFKNCELITINTYRDYDGDIIHIVWYWFISE